MDIRGILENVITELTKALAYIDAEEDCKIINFRVLKEYNTNLQLQKNNKKCIEDDKMRKLKYGQGSICKRERYRNDGTIYTYWQARYNENGIQHTLTAKTQEECLKRLKEATKEFVKKNRYKNLTLGEWIDTYYKTYKEPFIGESTRESYTICIKKHISPELKKKQLNKVTSIDIMTCLNNLTVTRQKEITKQLLTACMRQALSNNLTRINAYDDVRIKKHKSKEKNILRYEDEPNLLELLDNITKQAVIGYLNTGCRLNELLNMKEYDIDRNNKRIIIRGTKTKNSYRIIPLLPKAEEVLPMPTIKERKLQENFKKASDKLNLDITIHDLRHTFATRCLEKGISMKIVQKWLGHSNYSTTADIYSHITSDFEQNEINKLLQ